MEPVVCRMGGQSWGAHRCLSPLTIPVCSLRGQAFPGLCGTSRITVKSADIVRHVQTEFGLTQSNY